MTTTIDVHDLQKRFGSNVAVDGVSLAVAAGEIFGLLGPNAAGKSTTIRLLCGILSADGGGGNVLGYDLQRDREQMKRHIGYVAQHFALYPELTVAENVAFYSGVYRRNHDQHYATLLQRYGLNQFKRQLAGTLSGGYKRRLSIVCALTHDPAAIFLDEPTAGIDPVTRKELWDIFYDLSAQGKTLFVTTHYMEEAERCHRLAFINRGRLVALGTPSEIKNQLENVAVYGCSARYDPALVSLLRSLPGVLVLNQFGDQLRVITRNDVSAETLATTLQRNGHHSMELMPVKPNIEDVFITLTRDQETP